MMRVKSKKGKPRLLISDSAPGVLFEWGVGTDHRLFRVTMVNGVWRLEERMGADHWIMLALDETHDALMHGMVLLGLRLQHAQDTVESLRNVQKRKLRIAG